MAAAAGPRVQFAALPEHISPSSIARMDNANPLFRWLRANHFTGAQILRARPGAAKEDIVALVSHTSLAATLAKHSTICVPHEQLPEFYRQYRDAYVRGCPLYIVEKVDRSRPNILFFDLDLLYMPRDPAAPARYDAFLDALVDDIVAHTFAAFDLGGLERSRAHAYVLSSDITPTRKDGADAHKHGLHLFFPQILVEEAHASTLRRHLVHHLVRAHSAAALAARYNLLLVDDKPPPPRGDAARALHLDAPHAHNDLYVYQKVIDFSVCKTRQIRLPGSRKLLQSKSCACEPAHCRHERVEHLGPGKAPTTSLFLECKRHYALRAVLAADGSRAPDARLAHLNAPQNIHELCALLSVRRPPPDPEHLAALALPPDPLAPRGADGAPLTRLLLDDLQVPDTPDDPRARRVAAAPFRYRKRRTHDALPELDAEGPDARAARLDELGAQTDKPPTAWRDLFMRWAAAFFPRDFDALNPQKYVERLELRAASDAADSAKRLLRADCIITESHCTNKTRTAVHNNKAALLVYDAKTHTMYKKCFCRCPTALGRRFGSCATHRDVVQLPPLRRNPRTQTQGQGQTPTHEPRPRAFVAPFPPQ